MRYAKKYVIVAYFVKLIFGALLTFRGGNYEFIFIFAIKY